MIAELRGKNARLWPGMIFALIGLNFCVVGLTIYASQARRASFAVEADYDRKALHWDESARQLARNAELGWAVRMERAGGGALSVSLVDRAGAPIGGAEVDVEAFHHARARKKVVSTLVPTGEGVYAGAAEIDVPGLWEFRFRVRRGPEVFTTTFTRAIVGGGA